MIFDSKVIFSVKIVEQAVLLLWPMTSEADGQSLDIKAGIRDGCSFLILINLTLQRYLPDVQKASPGS